MMAALLPHPLLSLAVAVTWVLLANDVTPGAVLLGLAIGIAVPRFTAVYWPERARIGSPGRILGYAFVVLRDIVVSNIEVARLVLFRPARALRSRTVTIPLDLDSPEAVTVLAGTITMTPGTLTADYDPARHTLSVHCLDAADPDAVVADIKARYETPLRSIFR